MAQGVAFYPSKYSGVNIISHEEFQIKLGTTIRYHWAPIRMAEHTYVQTDTIK